MGVLSDPYRVRPHIIDDKYIESKSKSGQIGEKSRSEQVQILSSKG